MSYLCRLNYMLFPLHAVSSPVVLHTVSVTRAFSVPTNTGFDHGRSRKFALRDRPIQINPVKVAQH